MGIRDRPISPGSPWQNAYVERLIGTVRRECLDRMLIFGEAHLPSGLVSLSPSQSYPACTTITFGYNFRKGQRYHPINFCSEKHLRCPDVHQGSAALHDHDHRSWRSCS